MLAAEPTYLATDTGRNLLLEPGKTECATTRRIIQRDVHGGTLGAAGGHTSCGPLSAPPAFRRSPALLSFHLSAACRVAEIHPAGCRL